MNDVETSTSRRLWIERVVRITGIIPTWKYFTAKELGYIATYLSDYGDVNHAFHGCIMGISLVFLWGNTYFPTQVEWLKAPIFRAWGPRCIPHFPGQKLRRTTRPFLQRLRSKGRLRRWFFWPSELWRLMIVILL